MMAVRWMAITALLPALSCPPARLPQIKDLARGAFGFVVLALDRHTGENVALKFIERGPQVGSSPTRRQAGGPAHAHAVPELGTCRQPCAAVFGCRVLTRSSACSLRPCVQHINKYVEREVRAGASWRRPARLRF